MSRTTGPRQGPLVRGEDHRSEKLPPLTTPPVISLSSPFLLSLSLSLSVC
ncbi:hypothetical protein HanXRQr2_Chr13g0595021 [Helianthus annuus]|uniref:Uncharacterized protein n=1 Tax=Helianthus annuus TaxID=4232 RepID=A0A9K3HCG5_HELAN|nr:hypothetical protein HanXRQr2_Chr13g0595021 [Helianthus annuus]KAJ0481854.1 hypothetical protein HanIR_Chr13g0647391 [Helianthus annuus]KAJ0849792.1 hypothetical protein HanPSC8_Chr13g0573051 [Helianthus annuus]